MAWFIKKIIFANGERYPILLGEIGVPDYWATLFVTTQFRNASKSANTMRAVLDAVRHLYSWANGYGIPLSERLVSKEFLTNIEIESLAAFMQQSKRDEQSDGAAPVPISIRPSRSRERARAQSTGSMDSVKPGTLYIRLTYVGEFLRWWAIQLIQKSSRVVDRGAHDSIVRMHEGLKLMRPRLRAPSRVNARHGLDECAQIELLNLVRPGVPENPFSELVQLRNWLIVNLLLKLGERAGELLSIKGEDIDFQGNTLVIPRRHDDSDDARADQPVAKTRDRRVPLDESLCADLAKYLTQDRVRVKRKPDHGFLLVTHKVGNYRGAPLSYSGLIKIFKQIKNVGGEDLTKLTPHVMRHTWNENFSKLMDEKGVSESVENKLRSYQMGWEETSGTAATYTRRHIAMEGMKMGLELQEKFDEVIGNGMPRKKDTES